MKIIEKTTLVLFSTLILILSVIFCLLVFGWLDVEIVEKMIVEVISNPVSSNILLGISTVSILLAIKCIFFSSRSKEETAYKNGILLENSDGKLLITKDTIEHLVYGVVKGFGSAENITTRIELDKENSIKVFVDLSVKENAIIKELSTNLQTKIKDIIKKASDLEVSEVNIKVTNVEPVNNIVVE